MNKKFFLLTTILLLALGQVMAIGNFSIQQPAGTDIFRVTPEGHGYFAGNLTVAELVSCDSLSTNANGFLTCGSDDGLSQEEVEDYVGGMVSGNTETHITVTYQDGDGTIDFVVSDDWFDSLADLQGAVSNDFHNLGGVDDDNPEAGDVTWSDLTDEGTFTDGQMCTYASGTGYISCDTTVPSDTTLSQEEVEDYAGAMWSGNTESLITIEYQDADGTIDASLDTASPSDGDTTHVSTADQIFDWVDSNYLSASPFGASIDDTEMTAEDFGDFTCTGNEDGCTLDATYLENVVEDSSPELGGNLDVNGHAIVGGGSTNVTIDGTGNFVIVLA